MWWTDKKDNDIIYAKDVNDIAHKVNSISERKYSTIVIGNTANGHTSLNVDYLCNGTDDQVEINSAIQSLRNKGGKILLLDGTYRITPNADGFGLVINQPNITIEGMGESTKLDLLGADTTEITFKSDNTWKSYVNIQLDGVYTNITGIKIYGYSNNGTFQFWGGWNGGNWGLVNLMNGYIHGGIYGERTVTFTNTSALSNGIQYLGFSSDNDFKISEVEILYSSGNAPKIVKVTNLRGDDPTADIPELYNGTKSHAIKLDAENTCVRDFCVSSSFKTAVGVCVAKSNATVQNLNIELLGEKSRGVVLDGGSEELLNIRIRNNTIYANSKCIHAPSGAAGLADFHIESNLCKSPENIASYPPIYPIGIEFGDAVNGYVRGSITKNHCSNIDSGIYVSLKSSSMRQCTIEENVFCNNKSYGIFCMIDGNGDVKSCNFSNNLCNQNALYGIQFYIISGSIRENIVAGNHCQDNGYSNIYLYAVQQDSSMAYNTISGNYCYNYDGFSDTQNSIYLSQHTYYNFITGNYLLGKDVTDGGGNNTKVNNKSA